MLAQFLAAEADVVLLAVMRGATRVYHLADQMQQASALGNEWRTMPLWGVSERGRFLHDGRALTMADAIAAHGGQAEHTRDLFLGLAPPDKLALLEFLNGI